MFTVVALYQITELVPVTDHDGNLYTNPDFPVGTVICRDKAGDWFYYTGPAADSDAADPKSWPRLPGKLYRDYWRCIPNADTSPYMRALLAARKNLIKGKEGDK
jgi:hypothetical protein